MCGWSRLSCARIMKSNVSINGRITCVYRLSQPHSWSASWAPFLTGITQLAIAGSLGFGGTAILEGSALEVGQLVAFTQYLTLVITPLAMLAILIPFVLRGDASAGAHPSCV